jgi:Big-like domain-containing protein
VNPVTNKIYVTNRADGFVNGTVTVIDGTTNAPINITLALSPTPIAVNPVTSQIFAANEDSNTVTVIDEQQEQAIPLVTTITPLAGNTTPSATPTFQFSATSTFAPTAPPVNQVYFQFDTWQGPWIAASGSAGSFSGTAPVLSTGTHILYAFATDGEDATSTITGLGNSPLTGSIAAYTFTDLATGSPTSTAVTSSLNPSNAGQSVTFTATVNSLSGTPTGSVTFFDGPSAIGTNPLSAGQATLTTSTLTAGTHSITARYSGDTTFAGSTSTALTQTVIGQPTTTAVASSLNPSTAGQAVTFTATVTAVGTPTGSVTFRDGTTTLGTGTLSAGQATFSTSTLAVGSHSITAAYQGDATFDASTSSALTQNVVGVPSSTSVTSSLNPATAGQSVTFTATVTSTSGTPTGNVTFFDGAAAIGSGTLSAGQATFSTASLIAGSHSITATYQGAGIFAGSTSTAITQTINPAASTTAVTSSLNPATAGQSVTFTATVTSAAAGTPTGTINFRDGANTLTTVLLNAGQATFSTSALAAGSHSISAIYSGDASSSSSISAALTQTISTAGLNFTIGAAPSGSTSATVKAGQQASFSLQLALSSTLPTDQMSVTVTCTGAPTKATCSAPAVPVTVTGAAPATVTITVSTTANALTLPVPSSQPRIPLGLLPVLSAMGMLALLFWLATNKKSGLRGVALPGVRGVLAWRLAYAAPALLLFLTLAFATGCGGGGGGTTPPPPPPNNGTPPGTYSLTVTATSGSVSHTQQLTLTVQ